MQPSPERFSIMDLSGCRSEPFVFVPVARTLSLVRWWRDFSKHVYYITTYYDIIFTIYKRFLSTSVSCDGADRYFISVKTPFFLELIFSNFQDISKS